MGAWDKPNAPGIRIDSGAANEELQHWHQWRTYVRLALDDKDGITRWYVISDNSDWERIVKFKKTDAGGGTYKTTDFGTGLNFTHSSGYDCLMKPQ